MFEINLEALRINLLGITPVYFDYFKINGEIAHAFGTLNENLIPKEFKPKDSSTNYSKSTNFKYFDVKKHGWRSISTDVSLVSIFE